MIVLGLTGSIGMGKSTTAQMFAEAGALVWNADAAVHRLYAPGGAAVGPVGEAFPGVFVDGAVDRARLAEALGRDDGAFKRLEAIVHPEVGAQRAAFRERAQEERRRGVVFDVPLLFETGGERNVQVVVVVSASAKAQRARALSRPGMSPEKFDAILKRQTPDAEKRRRAHYVVNTDASLAETAKQVRDFVRALIGAPGRN